MKGLDTGVLLALLEGSTRARDLVRRLRGTELGTSELNLLELAAVAAGGSPRVRAARLATLERLRQRLTVVPVDGRSTREAAVLYQGSSLPGTVLPAILGSMRAAGCDEVITDGPLGCPTPSGLKVRVVHL